MTALTTRTGDVLIVFPFEKLREALAEATKAIRDADRTVVDDDAFAKLCNREDNVVAHLAAHYPGSAAEAIFLLHILRDRMVENFNPDVRSAANRDIVRGVTAYLSDTMSRPRSGTELVKTDWRKLFDEYTRLTIATNADDGPTLAADCAAHTAIECKIEEAPIDGLESLIAKLAIIWNTDRGWVGGDSRSIALSSVLNFLAGETGFDPFIEYDRSDEMIALRETEPEGGGS